MIDTPEIVRTEPRNAAVIRFHIPKAEIQNVMYPGVKELLDTVAAQGMKPAGPVYSHHFRLDPEVWDFEIGVPVEKPVAPSGRVQPGQLPGAKVVRTVYRGGYEGLGEAWGTFMKWIESQGHAMTPNFWESYLSTPETGGELATELVRPLAD